MQSVQLPTLGILLAKKGRAVNGYGSRSKGFMKYQDIGSGAKGLNGIPIWRTLFTSLTQK